MNFSVVVIVLLVVIFVFRRLLSAQPIVATAGVSLCAEKAEAVCDRFDAGNESRRGWHIHSPMKNLDADVFFLDQRPNQIDGKLHDAMPHTRRHSRCVLKNGKRQS
jgi:hypothetical protein